MVTSIDSLSEMINALEKFAWSVNSVTGTITEACSFCHMLFEPECDTDSDCDFIKSVCEIEEICPALTASAERAALIAWYMREELNKILNMDL